MRLFKRISVGLSDFTNPRSLSRHFRQKRLEILRETLIRCRQRKPAAEPLRVLDLGGTARFWSLLPPEEHARFGLAVTLVNLPDSLPASVPPGFTLLTGDACSLPQFADQSFDLVHSNSVIEHVGDWNRMQDFARETLRLAPACFIQTPNWWFPLEPHFMTPFFHWLPRPLRLHLVQHMALGHMKKAGSPAEACDIIDSARLLTSRQMRQLFPGCRLQVEYFFGLPKSLLIIRD
jgi:hypothetical protein